MENIAFKNDFGILPTNNYRSAGMDMYIPKIDQSLYDSNEQYKNMILTAWQASYHVSKDEIEFLIESFKAYCKFNDEYCPQNQIMNIIQLFLALDSKEIRDAIEFQNYRYALVYFYENYVIFDNSGTAGIRMRLNDHFCVNSGLKVHLPNNTAGIVFNKSGCGQRGFDTRACVIDEDYIGYIHLSVAFTKNTTRNDGTADIYCGDKLVQMVVLPVFHLNPIEVDDETYNNFITKSDRGDRGFGSSDIKH